MEPNEFDPNAPDVDVDAPPADESGFALAELVTFHGNGPVRLGMVVEVSTTHPDGSPRLDPAGAVVTCYRVAWFTEVSDPIAAADLTSVEG